MTKIGGRITSLDCLRGWAAVYVLLYHTALIPNPVLQVPDWAAPVVLTGGTGVSLFFVASAFSLCLAARPGEERGRALAAFAARRFFRIAPLFYVILAVSMVRDWWVFSAVHGPAVIGANVAFLFNLWPGHETGIVWASWTIGVEMLFYAVFPFLLVRTKTVPQAAVAVLLALMIAMAYPELLHRTGLPPTLQNDQIQNGVLRHLPVFVFGILAYRVFQRYVERQVPSRAVGAALLLGAAYLYAALIGNRLSTLLLHDPYYWQAIIYGGVILGLIIYPTRLLVNRVTLHLGKISYSLYLIHPLIVFALIPFYRWVEALGWVRTLSFGVCAAVTLAVTASLATLTYALVESPGMRVGSRLAGRLTRGMPKTVVYTA